MLFFGVNPPMRVATSVVANYRPPNAPGTFTPPNADVYPTANTVSNPNFNPGTFTPPVVQPPANTPSPDRTSSGIQPPYIPGTFPQPSPPAVPVVSTPDSWPPSCPSGTEWDDATHSCIGYNYSTPGYGPGYMPVTSAGPSIYVTQEDTNTIKFPKLSRGAKIALGLFGLGLLALGAFSVIRR